MSKLVIFDLDGVLVEAKKIHFDTLNQSLCKLINYEISWEDHLKVFDGLKTKDKINILRTQGFSIDQNLENKIFEEKQKLTLIALSNLSENFKLIHIFQKLKQQGYKISCCSNSVRNTVNLALQKIGLFDYFDLILSNDDVNFAKPHPEIYWKAMSHFGVYPNETLIVEDSPTGLKSAYSSGAKVLRVDNPNDFDYELLDDSFNSFDKKTEKWVNSKMNVIIPMAGYGSRFSKAGYTFPKPLIEVNGKPMIQVVIDNLRVDANYIFIVQKEHREKYNLDCMLSLLAPGCKIVDVENVTEGAACTVLLGKDFIDNDDPLLIANSDQFIEWNSLDFFYKMNEQNLDGGIVSFKSTHPKWSYAKLNEDDYVTEVAEKKTISENATAGIYYWKKGSDFVRYAKQMINKNIRVNNEFYVCPVYNEAIRDGFKIKTFDVHKMWGLGTPEDLAYYLENNK